MTTAPHDPADDPTLAPEPPTVHTGLWRLPAGRRMVTRIRRAIRTALRRWGLGPEAKPLAQHVVSLTKELAPQPADRTHGPLDLRLELRPTHRLLLVQLHTPDHDKPPRTDANDHRIIAITYGYRPTRYGPGTLYTHTFTWRRPAGHSDNHPD
ncbi:hypothetical protein GCM10023085_25060 [Actinomadura viridis]|uniref:Uncharacterized protein n=1 Tax=Actinomadura viridis TaxID=58110 RepID=A0A931DJU0_9ACTN|nr:hypothetical protein [Actinomadura viridis]MBG6088876.1 hypothetical protein [Actinomadura viridis]